MSLATRCTACGTIFRVVQDQLKVSEGWVRCGRCQQVFNALQNLFDLEREAPPPWPPQASEAPKTWDATLPVPPGSTPAPRPAPAPEPERAVAGDEGIDSDPSALSTQPLLRTASLDTTAPDEPTAEDTGFEDARFNEDLLDEEEEDLEVFGASQLEPMPSAFEPPHTSATDLPPPRFIREAEQAARWNRPAVRVTLALLLVLSTLGLLGQVGVHWRAEFAARWPESRVVLDPLCAALDCRILPPRRLERLSVDASGLTQLAVPGQYKLSVVLRNHGQTTVLLPAVELTLTNALGSVVARKVLTASELGAHQDSIGAGAELSLQALLGVGDAAIAGYTVDLFYP